LAEGAKVYYFYLPKDFATTNWYYVTGSTTSHVEIIRGTGYGESFNDAYLVGDADYASTTTGKGSTQTIYIDAFAVAYGYDFSKLTATYSFPASLYQPIGGSNGYTLP
jgi:hypothetical protein